ncbi:MAG: class I SAM-dependent methyltransferase [Myxococcota bacterium]|nr:class I SAM-dependent methyltransferase [Myxococcota bacterium]
MLTLVPCPLCGEAKRFFDLRVRYPDEHIAAYRQLYGDKAASEWKSCGTCGFVHQNPRPSIEALNAFYTDGAYHTTPTPLAYNDRDKYMKFARWYYGDKIDYSIAQSRVKTGRVFEMGFGFGGALELFRERGWEVYGREPDGRLAAFAREQLGLVGPECGLVDETTKNPPVDLVFSNHAFEHVADLHGVMSALRSIMKPGGLIVTVVPTYAANRSNMSLRWMNSAHYSMFTTSSLDQLVARHGFEPVTGTYRGWRKEIDDVWHVARYTGKTLDPTKFYEDPDRVARFVNWVNPLRSLVYYPVFSNYHRKVARVQYVQEVFALARDRLLRR